MITARKRILAASTPTIVGAVAIASALCAAELMSGPATATEAQPSASRTVEPERAAAEKGDLKVDLADVHSRPMRCVSGNRETTCTGWPVTGGMLAYRSE